MCASFSSFVMAPGNKKARTPIRPSGLPAEREVRLHVLSAGENPAALALPADAGDAARQHARAGRDLVVADAERFRHTGVAG